MLTLSPIKRGDSFAFYANFLDVDTDEVITGIATSLKCQARDSSDNLAIEFTIQETATAGTYLFTAPSTNALPTSQYIFIDIEYTQAGTVVSSETFAVYVEGDVTHV